MYNATSQVGSSLGVAVAASILTSRLSHNAINLRDPAGRAASIGSFQDVFVVLTIIAFVGSGVALLINDRAAAATMVRGEKTSAMESEAVAVGAVGPGGD